MKKSLRVMHIVAVQVKVHALAIGHALLWSLRGFESGNQKGLNKCKCEMSESLQLWGGAQAVAFSEFFSLCAFGGRENYEVMVNSGLAFPESPTRTTA